MNEVEQISGVSDLFQQVIYEDLEQALEILRRLMVKDPRTFFQVYERIVSDDPSNPENWLEAKHLSDEQLTNLASGNYRLDDDGVVMLAGRRVVGWDKLPYPSGKRMCPRCLGIGAVRDRRFKKNEQNA